MEITHYSLGTFVIDRTQHISDIKIIGPRVYQWKRKDQKLTREDIIEIMEKNPDIIIIGTGAAGLLQIDQDAKNAIEARGIKLIILRTPHACKEFNLWSGKGKKVNAILKSTS